MNKNTEYEKFTQEVYQELIKADGIKTISVQHNVKLAGKSGQQHQIDIYWEYEYAGVTHKVAIECKNYNSAVPIGNVRDFYGALSDLNNVAGIMVTKVGYQAGAKKYADTYGISLKELRTPNLGEAIIGEIELNLNITKRQRLFLVDDEWAQAKNINLSSYKSRLDSISFPPKNKWVNATHIPLETVRDAKILDEEGRVIITFDELEDKLPQSTEYVYHFENAYIDTCYWGQMKIKEVKYAYIDKRETKVFAIDARELIKAIFKDALSGEIKIIGKKYC